MLKARPQLTVRGHRTAPGCPFSEHHTRGHHRLQLQGSASVSTARRPAPEMKGLLSVRQRGGPLCPYPGLAHHTAGLGGNVRGLRQGRALLSHRPRLPVRTASDRSREIVSTPPDWALTTATSVSQRPATMQAYLAPSLELVSVSPLCPHPLEPRAGPRERTWRAPAPV